MFRVAVRARPGRSLCVSDREHREKRDYARHGGEKKNTRKIRGIAGAISMCDDENSERQDRPRSKQTRSTHTTRTVPRGVHAFPIGQIRDYIPESDLIA